MAHPINIQTGSNYTLQASDATEPETFIFMNNASANTVTLNSGVFSPPGGQGFLINIIQIGVGQTSLVAGSGVTISSPGGSLAIAAQYQGASLTITSSTQAYLSGALS